MKKIKTRGKGWGEETGGRKTPRKNFYFFETIFRYFRCSANIHNVYNQAIELTIEEEKPRIGSDATQVVILPSNFLEKKTDTEMKIKTKMSVYSI